MYEAKLAVVYILIAASACVRCSGWYWSNLRSHRPIHHDVPVRNCDTENKDTLAEIKSEIQNLQQLVAGLRGKVDPDLKLLHPHSVLPLNCNTEYTNTLAGIKLEIRNLQQVVVGLRQKLDPDLKLPPPLTALRTLQPLQTRRPPKVEEKSLSDPCNSNPCKFGGTCNVVGSSYECICKHGHSGKNCETEFCHMKADVIFVLDASASISGPDFKQQLNFVRTVIRDIHIDPAMVRCGLVTYGDKIRVEFGLRTYSSAESAMKAVSLVRQLRGNTRTDLAIQTVRQMMADDKRSGVPQIGIVITDGQSDNQTATRVEAEAAHQAGITMFAVGVGKHVDDKELGSIASQKDYRFNVESFNGLETIRKILTTKACDVESKNDQTTETVPLQDDQTTKSAPPQNVTEMCPPGFTYVSSAARCYKVVYEGHDWYSAGEKCQELHRGSHLAAITSATENTAVKKFLASELSKNVGSTAACVSSDYRQHGEFFWTSGQRLVGNSCKSTFVWKPWSDKTLSFEFARWAPGQPDCYSNKEFCIHFWPKEDFAWNDLPCNARICPLCEYSP